jgi:UDP-N-acetylglucosamine 2-epimerase
VTRICIVSSHRAERGLLQPLIDRLEAHPDFEVDTHSLCPVCTFNVNYNNASNHFAAHDPDVVIIPCDRLEAFAGAIAAFELGIPIIHFHAGDTGTWSNDEVYRAAITMMASVHLCNGPTAKNVVIDLLTAVKRSTEHVYDVGSTAMDDVEIVKFLDGVVPYDLVLYHPPGDAPKLIDEELDEIERIITTNSVYEGGDVEDVSHRHVYWIHPNGDPGSTIIMNRIEKVWRSLGGRLYTYANLPRSAFLGLMKNCSRYIGNSSSMVCEAPMWLAEI